MCHRASKSIVMRCQPAGDFNYEAKGAQYSTVRRPEPLFARAIRTGLGDVETVINVGSGAGSYEPEDLLVTAVEPSATMRAQRSSNLPPAVDAAAEDLPFAAGFFDAAIPTVTIHQWRDLTIGLAELRRVTRGPIVIMTFDPRALQEFWLALHSPELMQYEAGRMPNIDHVTDLLGGSSTATNLAVPQDCDDGFAEAFFGRPEAFLDAEVRRAQSAGGFLPTEHETAAVNLLQQDLEGGEWDARHGELRELLEYHGSLRLVVNHP